MTGKETCARLREIRNDIAVRNGLTPVPDTCTHSGDCPGTCPKCEAELKTLSEALEARARRKRRVALAGVSVGLCAALAGCSVETPVTEWLERLVQPGEAQQASDPGEAVILMGEVDISGTLQP